MINDIADETHTIRCIFEWFLHVRTANNVDLKNLFTPYGEVDSAIVARDKMFKRSRGFGFVEMQDEAAAQKAVRELNGVMVEGRSIKVSEARAKESRERSFTSKNY